jgi:hypothetical protein
MIPTAEEMFEANPIIPPGVTRQACIAFMKVFAKLHVEAALKEASEEFNSKTYSEFVLNAYPIENIK